MTISATITRQWHVRLYDATTGATDTRIVIAVSVHGAFKRATAGRADWTEAEVCLPDGTQCAVYDR